MDPHEQVTVIIPVASGDESWRHLLSDLREFPSEVILTGPDMNSKRYVFRFESEKERIHFHLSPAGRGRQLNAGARMSRGRWLWFLHADSRVPPAALRALEQELAARASPALLFFDLAFLPDGPALTWLNALGANLRSHILRLPFGDQGFCVERDAFFELGAFNETCKIGEDHLFVWQCIHGGVPIRAVNERIFTSARKYRKEGWLNTTLRHIFLTASQIVPQLLAGRPSRLNPTFLGARRR